ncbi:MAG: PASTA domain-containing protein, partial [Bacteroidaceae bacterium]|nr:PASTA domain-containing protein [Bacteroidaceae bacterium]
TLAFYNAIANNGTMMRPRFIKHVEKDGRVVHQFEPEIIKEQICKPETLEKIQNILIRVVNEGVAKKAGSKQFQVAGKTGTAQVAQNGGYHNGTMHYLVSFCGYFPAENPKYTCIVAMRKRGTPASGGSQCGPVFKAIAERVYAKDLTKKLEEANDTLHEHTPNVKNGDLRAAEFMLNKLEISQHNKYKDKGIEYRWGTTESLKGRVVLNQQTPATQTVPNVVGMGAKDAVFLLESRGLKVAIEGIGKVYTQNIPPETTINKGAIISIKLK